MMNGDFKDEIQMVHKLGKSQMQDNRNARMPKIK